MFIDDPATWPKAIEIDGFRYGRIRPVTEVTVRKRIGWLKRAERGYSPQPYEQLIAAYRADGLEQEARRLAYARQRARHRRLTWPGRLWSGLLLVTVGYGYRTWLAAVWLSGLVAVGAVVFSWGERAPKVADPSEFNSLVYSVDALMPVGDLSQENAWQFTGQVQWLAWSYVLIGWLLTSAVIAGLARVINR